VLKGTVTQEPTERHKSISQLSLQNGSTVLSTSNCLVYEKQLRYVLDTVVLKEQWHKNRPSLTGTFYTFANSPADKQLFEEEQLRNTQDIVVSKEQ
jgi:hypothetical protein